MSSKNIHIAHLLREKSTFLAKYSIDSPRLSAELLLAYVLKIERQELLKRLIISPATPLTEQQIFLYDSLVLRRSQGEPVAYILGVKEFYGRSFIVTPDTLIPRPETELLVEKALEIIQSSTKSYSFVDLGTGSGCIGITLGLEVPNAKGVLLEKSKAALTIAQKNMQELHARNVIGVLGDFTSPPLAFSSFDLVVSNPPYISASEYEEISKEVSKYEPLSALVPQLPSANGLEHLQKIASIAKDYLTHEGWLLMEMGYSQGAGMSHYLHSQGWNHISVVKDIAGLDRVLIAQCR